MLQQTRDKNMKRSFALFFSLILSTQINAAVSEGSQVPSFSLQTLQGGGSFNSSSLKGKVTLIDFFASWCIPCRGALPAYQKINDKFASQGFKVIAINIDKDAQAAMNFLKKYSVSYTILHDPDGKVAAEFGLPTMPSSYLVNKSGSVVKVYAGYHSGDASQIEGDVQKALGG